MAAMLSLAMVANLAFLLWGLVALWRRRARPYLLGLAVQAAIVALAFAVYLASSAGDDMMEWAFFFGFALVFWGVAVVIGGLVRLIRGGPASH